MSTLYFYISRIFSRDETIIQSSISSCFNSLTSSRLCNAEDNTTQEIANNFTDVGASKEPDEIMMDSADSPRLQRGEFVLERRQLVVPDDGAQVFWNCIGG